jgi:ABC-type antimicrobial peptide transport system permease subunit
MSPTPPKRWTRIFKWFSQASFQEELLGDLEEGFYENLEIHGPSKARRMFIKEILMMIRPSVIRPLNLIPINTMRLTRNYLKTSIRAIKLNPFYVFANVFGLALALSICTVGYFNHRFNATFNEYFEKAESLYKVHGLRTGESTLGISSIALAPNLKLQGVESFRYIRKSLTLADGDRLFNSNIAFVDPEFLDHFEFRNIEQNPVKAPENNQIILSQETAKRLFDNPYPIGELVSVSFPNLKKQTFIVKDVYLKPPTNTSFSQSAFMSLNTLFNQFGLDEKNWSQFVDATFIHAPNNEDVRRATLSLESILEVRNQGNPQMEISTYRMDGILDWPAFEGSLYGRTFVNHLHPSSVMGIAGSAIAILLLACFNFINTSIALSGKRLREIAVRKILGGNRRSTMGQFLIENTFMITLSVILSVIISYFLIPAYNALFQRELIQMDQIPYVELILFAVAIIIIVTILAAAYPALYISKFSALKIFSKSLALSGKNRLMAVLLTFQFALCFYNFLGLYLLIDNAYYQNNLDRGYNVQEVINIPLNRPEQYQVIRDRLAQETYVRSVSGSQNIIGYSNETAILTHEGMDHTVTTLNVGKSYPETVGLRLVKGSFFYGQHDATREIIVNQTFEKQLGIDVLNENLSIGGNKYKVIGVVDDFNVKSIVLRDSKIPAVAMILAPPEVYNYAVFNVSGVSEDINRSFEKAWYETFPEELYGGFPQSRILNNILELNKVMIRINSFVGLITILISALGLYTLISLTVQKRSKEFGVRKVLGATQSTIINLLGKDLYLMIGLAAIFGLTSGALVFRRVFDIIYAYHLEPDTFHFLRSVASVLIMVVLTIGYQVYRTSKMNPSEQLRLE